MTKRIGKFVKIYLDDSGGAAREISGDIQDAGGLPLSYDEVEVSGYGQNKYYLSGQQDSDITLTGLCNPAATTGFHTVSTGIVGNNGTTTFTLTVQFGDNAAATTGDPELEGECRATAYTVTADKSGALMATLKLRPADGTGMAWGSVA